MKTWKVAVPLLAILVPTVLVTGLRWRENRSFARYRFRVTQNEGFGREVAFLEKRITQTANPFYEMNELAHLLASQARWTGDETLYDRAEALARKSLDLVSVDNGNAILVLAQVAQARHGFHEAIRLAESVRTFKTGEGALGILVTCRLATGDYLGALRDAQRLVESKPLPGSLALRALALSSVGRDEEAAWDFDRALFVEDFGNPREGAWVRSLYGRFLLRRGDLPRARTALAEAVRIFPEGSLAWALLAEADAQQEDWLAADAHLVRAFELSPQARYLRSRALVADVRRKAALAADLRAQAEAIVRTELTKGRTGHRLDLVPLLLDRGRPEDGNEAMALMKEELKLRRSHDALYWAAETALRTDRPEEARDYLEEILSGGERRAEFWDLAARLEAKAGQKGRAEGFRDLAKKTNPLWKSERRERLAPLPAVS